MKELKQKESFMQGILALMFSQVLIKILGLVYKLYLTNKQGFGDAGNAIYNSGFQIYALLLTISSIGVPNAVAKLVSEKISIGNYRGANRIFKIAFFTFAIIGAICSTILFLGAKNIANIYLEISEAESTLVALSPAIFFVAIISVLRGYFNGISSIKTTANSQTLEQFFKTVFTIIIVELIGIMSGLNTTLMAAGANLATTLATIASFMYLAIYYKNRKEYIVIAQKNSQNREGIIKTVKKILFVSIPMSLSSILTSINKNIDSFTVVKGLKNCISAEEAKIQYGILSGKVDTLTTLPLSFNIAFATALVPAISSAKANKDNVTIVKRVSFSLLLTILIALPCTFGMIVFADPILNLLFPNSPAGSLILQISAISIIFTALEQTVNGALQGIGKIFVPAIALIIGVLVKLALNLTLTKISPSAFILGGAAGAAFATAICHIIASIIGLIVLNKTIKLNINFKKFVIKPIISTIIMITGSYITYIVLIGIISQRLATIIALIFSVTIYIIAIIILKVFSREDVKMMPYINNFLK